jgi:hypothetical protein
MHPYLFDEDFENLSTVKILGIRMQRNELFHALNLRERKHVWYSDEAVFGQF